MDPFYIIFIVFLLWTIWMVVGLVNEIYARWLHAPFHKAHQYWLSWSKGTFEVSAEKSTKTRPNNHITNKPTNTRKNIK